MLVKPLTPGLSSQPDISMSDEERFIVERCRRSPRAFAEAYLGVQLWRRQEEVLEALSQKRRVAVKAGNGLGKGFTAAVAVLWFLSCHSPAIVLTTAPTARQVRHVLWREIRRLHGSAAGLLGGAMLTTRYELANDRFALGLSTDEADQFQGFHSPNMLIVVDEAEGVSEQIYEAIDAVMTASNCKLLLIGNPTSDSGTFRRAFHEDRRMYHTITISALESPNVEQQQVVVPGLTTAEWVTERAGLWGEASPMYQARVLGLFCDQPQNCLIPLSKIEQAIARHKDLALPLPSVRPERSETALRIRPVIAASAAIQGPQGPEDSVEIGPVYPHPTPSPSVRPERSETALRIKPVIAAEAAIQAPQGPEDSVEIGPVYPHPTPSPSVRPERSEAGSLSDLPRSEVSRSHEVEGPAPDDENEAPTALSPTVLSVDVARFGQDRSVLLLANSDTVLHIESHRGLDTMELTGRIVEAHRHWKPQRIVVDEIGIGAGVVDRLKELDLPVTGINVARPARSQSQKRKLFANLRAEGYWDLYELFNQGAIAIPDDPELAGQLSSLRPGYNSLGQFVIEKKSDARARGLPSPDKADALMLAFLRNTGGVRLHT